MKKWGIWIGLAVLLAAGVLVLSLSRKQPVPVQPIAFSHKIHAGDYKINCQYCHIYARRAGVAGIPTVQRCMGCHKITAADKPEVQKLQNYWNQKQPIRWVQVTSLPDYVYFEHAPHIRSKVQCQTCHGPVETMEQTKQISPIVMSRCLACHRTEKASIDCLTCHR